MAHGLLVVPRSDGAPRAQSSAGRRAGSCGPSSEVLGTRRTRTTADIPAVSGSRPVMLVTFDVPFEPEATELAVDAAVESGQRLIIVNAVEITLGPLSLSMKYEYVAPPEVEDALRAPAELAHSLAVDVERLRLLQPAADRGAARARRRARAGTPRRRARSRAAEAEDVCEAGEANPGTGSVPRLVARVTCATRRRPAAASRARARRPRCARRNTGAAARERPRVEARGRSLDADDPGELAPAIPHGGRDCSEPLLALLPRLGETAPAYLCQLLDEPLARRDRAWSERA